MGINLETAEQHISKWSRVFSSSKPKKNWPRSLFHACHVETAAAILNSGKLICRQSQESIIYDVADQGALNNNCETHAYCRLHFRPKNKFHLRTEGVKVLSDPNRMPLQMSVPIFFIFKAEKILTLPETRFTCGAGSRANEPIGDGNEFFQSMKFNLIYHDEWTSASDRAEIHAWRMAEVLVPGTLGLEGNLSNIICRTPLDVETLKAHLTSETWNIYRHLVKVEEVSGSCFLHLAAYLQSVHLDSDGRLHFTMKLPSDRPTSGTYKVVIRFLDRATPEKVVTLPEPNTAPGRYRVTSVLIQPTEKIEIYLEDSLVFRGIVPGNTPII